MPSRRQAAILWSIAIAVIGAVVIWFGAAAIVLAIYGRHAPAAAPWLALAKFASLAWAAAVGWLVTWRRLDEMEQEARKLCWFVGSTAAILLTAPVMLLWLVNGGAFLAQHLRRGTPGAYFAVGWVGLVIAQLLCSLLARVGWWAAKR
ncbi:MAG: hypothetical protein JO127_09615 [Caulobacteraceae bacterium]|nr:hypothetical protein [Caulobacteraceae bacterium]